jgi:hypothetical protein
MIAEKDSIEPGGTRAVASQDNGAVVARVVDPGSEKAPTETAVNDRGYNMPNSRKIYVIGKLHPDIRVPFFVIPSEVEGSLDISVRL